MTKIPESSLEGGGLIVSYSLEQSVLYGMGCAEERAVRIMASRK